MNPNLSGPKAFAIKRAKHVLLWILQVSLSALFLMAAYLKLSAHPYMVTLFNMIGAGQWFRLVTGAIELVGAVGILIPRFAAAGAALLGCVMAGAIIAYLTVLDPNPIAYSSGPVSERLFRYWMIPILPGILCGIVAWGRWARLAKPGQRS